MYSIIIYEVPEERLNDFQKALNYLDTRTWGFIPYSEIEQGNSFDTLEAEGFMDEESDIDQILDYLDSYDFYYAVDYANSYGGIIR